jgi:hypothetical protein
MGSAGCGAVPRGAADGQRGVAEGLRAEERPEGVGGRSVDLPGPETAAFGG